MTDPYQMIFFVGPDKALELYLRWGVTPPCPELAPALQRDINAVADGTADDGQEFVVRLFDLEPFVHAAQLLAET